MMALVGRQRRVRPLTLSRKQRKQERELKFFDKA